MYPQSNDQRDHSGEFGTALKIATFNLRNCALPHFQFYDNQDPYDENLYRAKRDWTARQIDAINADMIRRAIGKAEGQDVAVHLTRRRS